MCGSDRQGGQRESMKPFGLLGKETGDAFLICHRAEAAFGNQELKQKGGGCRNLMSK